MKLQDTAEIIWAEETQEEYRQMSLIELLAESNMHVKWMVEMRHAHVKLTDFDYYLDKLLDDEIARKLR